MLACDSTLLAFYSAFFIFEYLPVVYLSTGMAGAI